MTATGIHFRTTARAAVVAFLETFKTAHAADLRAVHRARPASFAAVPCVYVTLSEPSIEFPGFSIRKRNVEVQVVLVDALSDNEVMVARLDELTDELILELAALPHILGTATIVLRMRAESSELELGGVFYAASIVTLLGSIEENQS